MSFGDRGLDMSLEPWKRRVASGSNAGHFEEPPHLLEQALASFAHRHWLSH